MSNEDVLRRELDLVTDCYAHAREALKHERRVLRILIAGGLVDERKVEEARDLVQSFKD